MPFTLERSDYLERKEHHGAVSSAVEQAVTLPVAVEAALVDERFEHALFRHAAARGVD
jgi:hypothetical protein